MISPKSLILSAPLKEETKNELFQSFETLDKEKQIAIVNLCWSLISSEFQTKLSLERQKMMLEMASQEKTYSTEDFDKVEDNMLKKLLQKLEATGNEEKIEEVRKQLEVHADSQDPIQKTNPEDNSSQVS